MSGYNLDTIILIGPLATGKSTIGYRLSERLNLPNYPIDRVKWFYRFCNGYNLVHSKKTLGELGFKKFLRYAQKYFTPSDLEDVLIKFRGVVDLGATDSYADKNVRRLKELRRIMEPYQNVFLILPSASVEKSEEILEKRLYERYKDNPLKRGVIDSYIEMNNIFLRSSSNFVLAKHVIYTEDRSIDEVCDEIIGKCVAQSGMQVSDTIIEMPELRAG